MTTLLISNNTILTTVTGFGELDYNLFLNCFNQSEIAFYAAYCGSKMVATSLLFYKTTTAGIYHVVTLQEYQEQGVGSQTFRFCQKEALKNGATNVIAQSTQDGLSAWKKTGMKQYGNFYLLCCNKSKQ